MKITKKSKAFKELLEGVRQTPSYYLAGLEMAFEERIARYKLLLKLERTSQDCMKAKIRAVRVCLKDVRRELASVGKFKAKWIKIRITEFSPHPSESSQQKSYWH